MDVTLRPDEGRQALLEAVARALAPPRRVLVIAAERESRDELRQLLADPRLELLDARDAQEGLRRAREERPAAVVIDASSPGFAGSAAALLRGDPQACPLPLLVRAARSLAGEEQQELSRADARVVELQQLVREEAGRRLRAAVWETTHG